MYEMQNCSRALEMQVVLKRASEIQVDWVVTSFWNASSVVTSFWNASCVETSFWNASCVETSFWSASCVVTSFWSASCVVTSFWNATYVYVRRKIVESANANPGNIINLLFFLGISLNRFSMCYGFHIPCLHATLFVYPCLTENWYCYPPPLIKKCLPPICIPPKKNLH